jgi:hypothetical protein
MAMQQPPPVRVDTPIDDDHPIAATVRCTGGSSAGRNGRHAVAR